MAAPDLTDAIADRVAAFGTDRPVRVAVDGITGAGKTTFAEHLADTLRDQGRPVVRVTMDGFHHPRAVRYRQGRGSADGYYEDAYDFEAVRRVLLDPLGPGGDGRYRTAVIDLAADVPVEEAPVAAPPGSVLVVDGSFLQKPALRDGWDLVVYLRASFEAAEERGARRDADLLGGLDAARSAFRTRYHAAQRRYLAECDPEAHADVVVDVEDPAHPILIR
jgi:uridine kinase